MLWRSGCLDKSVAASLNLPRWATSRLEKETRLGWWSSEPRAQPFHPVLKRTLSPC